MLEVEPAVTGNTIDNGVMTSDKGDEDADLEALVSLTGVRITSDVELVRGERSSSGEDNVKCFSLPSGCNPLARGDAAGMW